MTNATHTVAHTPTPWAMDDSGPGVDNSAFIVPTGEDIAYLRVAGGSEEQNRINAAFIVRACNAHDALVAALEDALDRLASVDRMFHKAIRQEQEGELGQITRGRAALKLAKGEA